MWLVRHHTCGDIIDLDHESGRWRYVDDSEKPANAKKLVDLPVRGGYTDEGEHRFYKYWTDDEHYVFRTYDGKIFDLFHELGDGTIIELMPGTRAELEPSKYADGRPHLGYSDFRLKDKDGNVLYETTYFSKKYLDYYMVDFTPDPDLGLADWDFFVALKGGIEELSERARKASGASSSALPSQGHDIAPISSGDLLHAHTGDLCSRDGNWAVMDDLQASRFFRQGERFPPHAGRDVIWVWVP